MAINCQSCDAEWNADDIEFVSKYAQCPHCDTVFDVEVSQASTAVLPTRLSIDADKFNIAAITEIQQMLDSIKAGNMDPKDFEIDIQLRLKHPGLHEFYELSPEFEIPYRHVIGKL